jgi:hypothetical protein
MDGARTRKLPWLLACILLAVLFVALASRAGSFLIVDAPRPSDVILVLAGETDFRPERALELSRQGYGKSIVLDVPANARIYEFTQIELAERYVRDLQARNIQPASSMIVCPIDGLSTKDESKDAEKCLRRLGARSVLVVTADFHTRRAIDVFRREFPAYTYTIAAARNNEQFGVRWWRHRQWAKVCLDEWLRLIWWKAVDQWR